jgi:hypothetical protein
MYSSARSCSPARRSTATGLQPDPFTAHLRKRRPPSEGLEHVLCKYVHQCRLEVWLPHIPPQEAKAVSAIPNLPGKVLHEAMDPEAIFAAGPIEQNAPHDMSNRPDDQQPIDEHQIVAQPAAA